MHSMIGYGFRRLSSARGSTLLYVVAALAVLGGIAAGVAILSPTATQSKLEQESGERAFYNAQSGLNYILSTQRAFEANGNDFNEFINAMGGNDIRVAYNLPANDKFEYSLISNGNNGYYIRNVVGFAEGATGAQSAYMIDGNSHTIVYNPIKSNGSPAQTGNTVIASGYSQGILIAKEIVVHDGSTLEDDISSLSTDKKLTLHGSVRWTGTSLCSNDGVEISGGSTINGDINSHGNVLISSSTINGNVYAAGDVTIDRGSTINGDIHAQGNIDLKNGRINGDIYLNGGFDIASWLHFSGKTFSNPTSPSDCMTFTSPPHITPTGVKPLFITTEYTFTGVADLNDTDTNKYKSIEVRGGARLCFDLSKNNSYINIFVAKDVSIGGGVNIYIKTTEGDCFSPANRVSNVNFAKYEYASRIFMDVNGSASLGGASNWFGTIYSVGDIQPGGGTAIIGGLYSSAGSVNPSDHWYSFRAVSSEYFSKIQR